MLFMSLSLSYIPFLFFGERERERFGEVKGNVGVVRYLCFIPTLVGFKRNYSILPYNYVL